MKKFNAYYYLLFILLIMGAFASMAQNSYGLQIIGGVAFAFGLLFLIDLIYQLRKKGEKDIYVVAEVACLFVLSVIFAFRVFYIYFYFVEILFVTAGFILVLIYARRMIMRFRQMQFKNNLLALLLFVFHLSVILFLLSLVLVPFAEKTGEVTGMIAFVLLLVFALSALIKKNFLVDGEKTSALKTVARFKDYSIIIISVFVLFSLYIGLNKVGVVPAVYSDEFPQAYYKLVNAATSREEKPVDGVYKFEEFKKRYDVYLEHMKDNSK